MMFGGMHGVGGGWRTGGGDLDDGRGRIYDHHVIIRLARYLAPFRLLIVVSVATMLVYTGATVAIPWLIKLGIDDYIKNKDLTSLNWLALVFGALLVVHYLSSYIHQLILANVSLRVLRNLRAALFSHLQALSLSFYHRNQVGSIMSRAQNDVFQLEQFLSLLVLSLADLLSLAGIVTAMIVMHPPLAGTTLSVIPVLVIIMAVWQAYARRSFLRVRRAISRVNSALQENISGVRAVQGLNRQDQNFDRFDELNTEHLEANLQAGRLSSALLPAVELFTSLALAAVVVVGGHMVLGGSLQDVGILVAFALYIQRFFDPIRNLTMQYTQLQRAMTSGARIFELLDVEPEVKDKPSAPELPSIQGAVRYEHVGFAYTPGQPVLHDIDLSVEPGQVVALVGPTGAGKTTMVALLARFYDTVSGRITIDGHDLRDMTRDSLARQMGMVPQEPFLFSSSVLENIRYSHTDTSEQAVEQAARAVGAHEFISQLEGGYHAVLEERGGNLSVGERQLLSFARALVADPRILILDEATANIDTETEQLIQRALKRLLAGRTSLVIAHRLSTVRDAHKIVVMDRGQIIETGSHKDLLARGGLYALHQSNGASPIGAGLQDQGAETPAHEEKRSR